MTTALKQRIVGAVFILSLGVILIPLILDKPQAEDLAHETLAHEIPDAPALPDVSEVSKIHYVFDDAPHPAPDTTTTVAMVEPPSSPAVAPTEVVLVPAPSVDELAPVAAPSVSTGHLKASASLAEAAQTQWTIQLGAFTDEKNAKALVQKLSQNGFTPYLKSMAQDSLVRVYVSPGIPRDKAVDLAAKLDAEYGLKGIVVRYFR